MPPDHIVSMLEGVTNLCHYCLLDQQQDIWIAQHTPSSAVMPEQPTSSNLLTGLAKMFTPYASSRVS